MYLSVDFVAPFYRSSAACRCSVYSISFPIEDIPLLQIIRLGALVFNRQGPRATKFPLFGGERKADGRKTHEKPCKIAPKT